MRQERHLGHNFRKILTLRVRHKPEVSEHAALGVSDDLYILYFRHLSYLTLVLAEQQWYL